MEHVGSVVDDLAAAIRFFPTRCEAAVPSAVPGTG
jgi:hypothetical protein